MSILPEDGHKLVEICSSGFIFRIRCRFLVINMYMSVSSMVDVKQVFPPEVIRVTVRLLISAYI